MRIIILLVLSELMASLCGAQSNKTYRVNPVNQDSTESMQFVYQYPQFQKGTVSFSNKPLASTLLNYNYLSGQILFITSKNDTLELASPEDLQFIAIGIDTFYYKDKGYIERLTHYPSINLYRKQLIKFKGTEKKGAYGSYSGTSASNSIETFSDETNNRKLIIDENTLYASSYQYYFSDPSHNFGQVSKKNLYKFFPLQKKEIDTYLTNNTVHFNKERDVLGIIQYLQAN